jgi:hypothetical protein
MSSRGRAWASPSARVLPVFLAVAFVTAPVLAQQKDTKPKLDKTQLQEAQAVTRLIDTAEAGQPTPSDVPITFEGYHFFKATSGKTYVPFTVDIDSSALANPAVTVMLRVVKTGATPPPPKKEQKPQAGLLGDAPVNDLSALRDISEEERARAQADKEKPNLPPATFEDLYFVDLRPLQPGSPAKLSRAFQADAGEYDLYVGLKERNPADKKKPKMAVFRQALSVPDYWTKEFSTSSLVVAEKVGTTAAVLTADQQRENPYTIGNLQIVPRVGTKFAKTEELAVYFQIYNPALDSAGKPDVVIDGSFYQKNADGEKKIFNTDPSAMNASTLPAQFEVLKNPLPGGGAWGLSSFPAGDFRMEFKITDKVSGKILTRSVAFSVS